MAACRGIDVSAYQKSQDWAGLKADGIVFAFAKASEGQRSRDDMFAKHITGIVRAGLVPGAYHFGWPTQDPAAEAANYIAAVKPYATAGFVHWLDLERRSDGANYAGRSAAQIKAWAAAWVTAVQAAFPGQCVGVYTSADDLSKDHVPAGVPLWYPAYTWGSTAVPYWRAEAAPQPHPSGWSPLFWQFTSTPLDRSICYLSEADLRTWAAGDEEDVALSDADKKWLTDTLVPLVTKKVLADITGTKGVWYDDVIAAVAPPYNNADYYGPDGKTPANTTWTAKYALGTTAASARQAVALLEDVKAQLAALDVAALQAALAAKIEGLKLEITVTDPQEG